MDDQKKLINFLKDNINFEFTISELAFKTGIYQQKIRYLLPKLIRKEPKLTLIKSPLRIVYVKRDF